MKKLLTILILTLALFIGAEIYAQTTYDIATGADDGVEVLGTVPGTWTDSNATNRVGCDQTSDGKTTTNRDYLVGVRFLDVNLPSEAPIESSVLAFDVTSITNSPDLIVYGHYADNTADFSASSGYPSQFDRTDASVVWQPSGTGRQEIDVTDIIQEIVNRSDFEPGNDIKLAVYENISFLAAGCSGNHYAVVNQYENSPATAPELVITTEDKSVLIYKAGSNTTQKLGSSLDINGQVIERTPGDFGTQYTAITDYLQHGDSTGFSESKTFTMSFWFKRDVNGVERFYAINPSRTFNPSIGTAATIEILGRNSAGSTILLMTGDTSTSNDFTTWHSLLVSVDMSDTNKRHIYLDDEAEVLNVTTYVDDLIDFVGTQYRIANLNGNNGCSCNLSEFYLDVGTYTDFSVEANRRKFRTAGGEPADLGKFGELPTGSRPEVYMSNVDGPNDSRETADYTTVIGQPERVDGPAN